MSRTQLLYVYVQQYLHRGDLSNVPVVSNKLYKELSILEISQEEVLGLLERQQPEIFQEWMAFTQEF